MSMNSTKLTSLSISFTTMTKITHNVINVEQLLCTLQIHVVKSHMSTQQNKKVSACCQGHTGSNSNHVCP